MHFTYRNVNQAFESLVTKFHHNKLPIATVPSRVGEIHTVTEPLIVTFIRPTERVLFNSARNANPFFHLYEALWMLDGRHDLKPLLFYVKDFDRFSDDGETLWGAYGSRWRYHFTAHFDSHFTNQIDLVIEDLKRDHNSRRSVIAMWDPSMDPQKAAEGGKDVPCNTHIYFRVLESNNEKHLDMTVCNRSNDLVLGMLGANVVHMSFLQEYIAASVGVSVGTYHQITNNLHVYTYNWQPDEWIAASDDYYQSAGLNGHMVQLIHGGNVAEFDRELPLFTEAYSEPEKARKAVHTVWDSPFLERVAKPMLNAHTLYKRDIKGIDGLSMAIAVCDEIDAADWRTASKQWLERKLRKLEG